MLIRGYQRFISPRKGFHCAYRVHTGCASCSALGFRAIRRHGVLKGLHLLSRRFERCAEARRQLQVLVRRPRLQAGFLDCGDCGGDCAPDCSPGDCACDALDALDCLDCGDWSRREDKRREDTGDEHPQHPEQDHGPQDEAQARNIAGEVANGPADLCIAEFRDE